MSACVAASLAALVRRRPAHERDLFASYWRDVHATLAARIDDSLLYRIHLLDSASPLLLPLPAEVEGEAPERERIDGIAELRWRSEEELERWSVNPILTEFVSEDEQNVFGHCAVYWARGDNVVEAKDEIPGLVVDGPQSLPTVILLARATPDTGRDGLAAYLRERLLPALVESPGVCRATLHLLDPYGGEWDSPNVGHGEGPRDYEAWAEITFAGMDACAETLRAPSLASALAAGGRSLGSLHAYFEHETYTLRHRGSPTLVGLRGYPVARTILAVGALNQMGSEVLAIASGWEAA